MTPALNAYARTGLTMFLTLCSPHILERVGELVADLVPHHPRDADPARRLEPGRQIHPVAKDVVAIDNDVAEIDADPKPDALLVGHFGVAVDHRSLDFRSAADGVHHARELHQHAVTRRFHDPTVVLIDLRIDE
jgi:hypothetical protein